VIAFYQRAIQFWDTTQAFSWVGIVTNDVSQTDKLRASAFARIREYRVERFEISMDITQDCQTHDQNLTVKH